MKFFQLLGFKLFVIIVVVMLIATTIVATVSLNWHSEQYSNKTLSTVSRMSDVLNRSMHYSMMLNRRDDIEQIITTVGNEPGIEVIRIYNKKGVVTFSSAKAEVGMSVNLNDEACNACHSSGNIPSPPNGKILIRIFNSPKGYRIMGMITPIKNERSCSSAECHAHPASQTVLGVLDVMVPLQELDASFDELKRTQIFSALSLVVIVGAFVWIFIWRMVNIPVRKLTVGTDELRKGNLDYRIAVSSSTEIGLLADSFNHMAEELQRAQVEVTDWAETLEQRVKEKTDELRRTQANIVQMEKMISLGTLAATVAHELNNPLEGVLTYAKLLKRKMNSGTLNADDISEMQKELSIIADETARCGNIVKNLLLFSRQKVGEMTRVDVRTIVEQSVKLIDHHLKMHNIKLATALGAIPVLIPCDQNQIEQALLAIEINAVEAMPEGGTLRIEIQESELADEVIISISDSGIGISEEDLPHIFEPFFTTKSDGKGTGLGLAVVYGIIERHNGTIEVQSNLHEGTTFALSLPKNVLHREETYSSTIIVKG